MHELSIAYQLIEIADDAARRALARRVNRVYVKLGVLSGVVKDALLFSYDVAAVGTQLEGSQLVVEEVPVGIFCAVCDQLRVLDQFYTLICPVCGTRSADIRQGRELEIVSLEVEDDQPAYS